jgi:hypothetical protein
VEEFNEFSVQRRAGEPFRAVVREWGHAADLFLARVAKVPPEEWTARKVPWATGDIAVAYLVQSRVMEWWLHGEDIRQGVDLPPRLEHNPILCTNDLAIRTLPYALGLAGLSFPGRSVKIDLEAVGKPLTLPELEFMHIHKTGALIRVSVLLGAYCGSLSSAQPDSAEKLDKLDRFGKLIGLAFQVVDDVLDCEADTATLGKTAGKDADNGKPTYVSLLGIQDARAMAQRLHREALETLEQFDDSAQRLRELADFIVLRKF